MSITKLEKYMVTKSNDLVEAQYKLSVYESRIILFLASKVQPQDSEFKRYRFSVRELAELMGVNNKNIYEIVRDITGGLLKKTFTIKKEESILQANWVASAEYFDGEGIVEFEFSPKLKPYFLQLKEKFTSYKLKDVLQLRSTHSFRIYELLKQYEKIGERTFTVESLKSLLQADNEYPRYSNFKQKVIQVAQKEIAEKTDLYFDVEEIKTGKKVSKLRFIIYSNLNNLAGSVKSKDRIEFSERLEKDYDLKKHQVGKIMRAHEKTYIENNLLVVDEALYFGKVQNKAAYTFAAISENYASAYTDYELNLMRSLQTNDDRQQYYELRNEYLKECHDMTNDRMDKILRNNQFAEHAELFMEKYPKYRTLFIEEFADSSTPTGQLFRKFVFEYNYPDFTFERFVNLEKRNLLIAAGVK